ncbi:BCL2/adenovirus E1B protein-interacting protein 3-like [Alligator mississippiensis]|uniref:BCL2/adenovirus E1B protein-interacting protein 3-like n=1 Tax=Alligator mississippiensis TaxID=8496 RepID=A0A151M5P4_ALLMI|nr:BCL2/adenovirus E1B protein-interacting protein 3-like [Alligator mississippiensis]
MAASDEDAGPGLCQPPHAPVCEVSSPCPCPVTPSTRPPSSQPVSRRTLALARPSLHGGAAGSKRRLFGSELLLLFVPSLLLSHLLTLGLGICIGKRLAAASASPL